MTFVPAHCNVPLQLVEDETSNFITIMFYDSETNILSWELSKGKISHARELGNIIVHLSPAGKPVLIEILNASKFVGKIDQVKIKEIRKALNPEI